MSGMLQSHRVTGQNCVAQHTVSHISPVEQENRNGNGKRSRSRSNSPKHSPSKASKHASSSYSVVPFFRPTGQQNNQNNQHNQNNQNNAALPLANLRHYHLCPHCEKDFPNLSSLNKHLTSHSQDRPHDCIVCSKKFKRFDHLSSHMLTHRGEKPFMCSYEQCQKRYSDQRSLKRHLEKNHSNSGTANVCSMHDRKNAPTIDDEHDTKVSPPSGSPPGHKDKQQVVINNESTHNTHSRNNRGPSILHGGHFGQALAEREVGGGAGRGGRKRLDDYLTHSRQDSPCVRITDGEGEKERGGVEEECDSDGLDYVDALTADERVGPRFQATIPPLQSDSPVGTKFQGELIWAASNVVDDDQIEAFIECAGSLAAFGGGWTPEYSLSVLHKHGGHIKTALGIILMPMKRTRRMARESITHWSEMEKLLFENGYKEVGKRFDLLQRFVLPKTIPQIIQFYYKWKKEEPEKYYMYSANHSRTAAQLPTGRRVDSMLD
eukprot:Ihof_evm2s573 gene=Ihof_evmTU2s573